MPGFDGSGPMGEGPMTGGARGYCNPGYTAYGSPVGYGYGRGMGYGRGFRRGYGPGRGSRRGYGRTVAPYAPVYEAAPADEWSHLKQQADSVKHTLDAINRGIAELETSE